MKIKAPWSDEQVKALTHRQNMGHVHPFTCGTSECRRPLVATRDGWICTGCAYRQDWAYDFMFQRPLPPVGTLEGQ